MVQGKKYRLAVALVTRRPKLWDYVAESLIRQRRRPDIVAICPHRIQGEEDPINKIFMSQALGRFLSRMEGAGIYSYPMSLKKGIAYGAAMHETVEGLIGAMAESGLICKVDDDDFYGPEYFLQAEACLKAHPEAILIGKHGFYTMWTDCPREPLFWEARAKNLEDGYYQVTYLGGPTICLSVAAYRKYPELRYDKTLSFGIDDHLVRIARAIWANDLKEAGEIGKEKNGWPPIYSTGPDHFILQRRLDPAHDHVWKAPELMKANP